MPNSASEVRQKHFVYDSNNRLLSTRVPDVTQAQVAPGASNFSIVTSDLVSRSIYDATGNEIQTIDARGGSVISYYDRLGRKVLQVDAENFVTAWLYDESGNVVQQIQYATKLSMLATTSSDPLSLVASLNSSPDNRVTEFTYDKLGRITEKRVLNVSFGQVSATSGGLTTATATAFERFTYDGLGNILSHSKAASASEVFVTNFSYDSAGRALSEKAPSYVDYQGVTVRPQTDYIDVASKQRAVPALRFDHWNPRGNNFVKFDGVEADGITLIDRKTALTTHVKQLQSLQRVSTALKQNSGYQVVYEFPSQKAADRAMDILIEQNITNITVWVAQ